MTSNQITTEVNVKRTRHSSDRFGNCEICNKFVDSVYFNRNAGTFGHKECLEENKNSVKI